MPTHLINTPELFFYPVFLFKYSYMFYFLHFMYLKIPWHTSQYGIAWKQLFQPLERICSYRRKLKLLTAWTMYLFWADNVQHVLNSLGSVTHACFCKIWIMIKFPFFLFLWLRKFSILQDGLNLKCTTVACYLRCFQASVSNRIR